MKRIALITLIGTALGLAPNLYTSSAATTHAPFYLQGKRVHVFQSAPHEVTLKYGHSTVFRQGNTCLNPTPRILAVWHSTYAGHTTDYAKLRWCSRTRTRGWQVS